MTDLEVVFGPRTRLAAVLLSRHPAPEGTERVLVARHEGDATWIADAYPRARVLHADRDEDVEPAARIRIYGCALGPVHPGDSPVIAADAARARADFDLVRRFVDRAPGATTELIFISSVLALAPRPRKEREYYTAWKRIVEMELARIVAPTNTAQLSVYYPGRLVHAASAGLPLRIIHTTFEALATLITAPVDTDSVRKVVGADARLWLLRRGVLAGSDIRPPAGGPLVDELTSALTQG